MLHTYELKGGQGSGAVAEYEEFGIWRICRGQTFPGLEVCQESRNHGKPLTWFKEGPCSVREFEPGVEVTASILKTQIHSPGFREEGRGKGAPGGCFCKEVRREKLKGPFVSSG